MTPSEIQEEIKEINAELNRLKQHRSPLQLRAWRRRKAKLKRWLNSYNKMMKFSRPKEQLTLSI